MRCDASHFSSYWTLFFVSLFSFSYINIQCERAQADLTHPYFHTSIPHNKLYFNRHQSISTSRKYFSLDACLYIYKEMYSFHAFFVRVTLFLLINNRSHTWTENLCAACECVSILANQKIEMDKVRHNFVIFAQRSGQWTNSALFQCSTKPCFNLITTHCTFDVETMLTIHLCT